MSENHSDLSELKSVFNPLFPAQIRVLFLRFSNLIIRQFIVSITYHCLQMLVGIIIKK